MRGVRSSVVFVVCLMAAWSSVATRIFSRCLCDSIAMRLCRGDDMSTTRTQRVLCCFSQCSSTTTHQHLLIPPTSLRVHNIHCSHSLRARHALASSCLDQLHPLRLLQLLLAMLSIQPERRDSSTATMPDRPRLATTAQLDPPLLSIQYRLQSLSPVPFDATSSQLSPSMRGASGTSLKVCVGSPSCRVRDIADSHAGKRCNGDFGTFSKKKCFRCAKLRRPCRNLHKFLIPPANRQFRARDALAALKRRGSGATDAQIEAATDELNAANAYCADQLKRFHTNRNSVVGETRTPHGKSINAAYGSGAASGTIAAMSLEEMQNIRSIMEDGLGLLSSVSRS